MCRFNSGVRSPMSKESCSSIITVFLPTWTITEIQMVLENRVGFHLSFEKTISHPSPGQMSISTAISVLTLSYSWRIITRYIVSTTWRRFSLLIWLSCFSIYDYDVWVWKDYPYTLASCERLYYSCLLFSTHAADLPLEFMEHHPQYIADGNSMGFLSDDGGDKFNLCHCKILIFADRCPPSLTCCPSLEQLWNSGYGLLARSRVYGFL